VSGFTLNFSITAGIGTMNPLSATTNSQGYAYSTLRIASLSGEVDAVVCAAGGGIPCPPLNVFQVPDSSLQLQPVSGAQQAIPMGQSFTPLRVRVLDSSNPPNPVYGVPVTFATTMLVPQGPGGAGHNPQRVIVGTAQSVVTSDADGYAAIIPPNGNGTQPLDVEVAATAGRAALQFGLATYAPPANSKDDAESATVRLMLKGETFQPGGLEHTDEVEKSKRPAENSD